MATPEQRRERVRQGSRRKRDLEGAAVTEAERAVAAGALEAFNAAAGTHYTLDAHSALILRRILERPELSADDHRAIVAAVFEEPWWTGHPGPRVIYGNAEQFERSIETWRSPGAPRRTAPKGHQSAGMANAHRLAERAREAVEEQEARA
jgi:hypothetical protein